MSYRSVFRPGLFDGQTIVVTGGGSGLGRCTAHELRSLGAKLALVGRTQAKLDQVKEELEQIKSHLVSQVPLGRMGASDEIAKVAVFLASDDSSFVTGVELYVDGGMAQV